MRSGECLHPNTYDRTLPECQSCPGADFCRSVSAACYGRAYSRSADAPCAVCKLAAYCKDAGDIHFYSHRHGEPSITATEEIETLAEPVEPQAEAMPDELAEVLDEFFAACGYSPVRVAVAVARHGGCPMPQIGEMLGGHPKQWVYFELSKITNPALREYLIHKKTGKFFSTAIREEAKRTKIKKKPRREKRVQGEFDFGEDKPKAENGKQLEMF